MVEFDVPVNKKQRLIYFPKILVDSFGHHLKLIPNTRVAILFAKDTPIERVLDSLAIIEADLRLRLAERKPAK